MTLTLNINNNKVSEIGALIFILRNFVIEKIRRLDVHYILHYKYLKEIVINIHIVKN